MHWIFFFNFVTCHQNSARSLPNHQRWHARWKPSQKMYTLHTRFCTFGADLYAWSVLIDKISASELNRKLLVGFKQKCKLPGDIWRWQLTEKKNPSTFSLSLPPCVFGGMRRMQCTFWGDGGGRKKEKKKISMRTPIYFFPSLSLSPNCLDSSLEEGLLDAHHGSWKKTLFFFSLSDPFFPFKTKHVTPFNLAFFFPQFLFSKSSCAHQDVKWNRSKTPRGRERERERDEASLPPSLPPLPCHSLKYLLFLLPVYVAAVTDTYEHFEKKKSRKKMLDVLFSNEKCSITTVNFWCRDIRYK